MEALEGSAGPLAQAGGGGRLLSALSPFLCPGSESRASVLKLDSGRSPAGSRISSSAASGMESVLLRASPMAPEGDEQVGHFLSSQPPLKTLLASSSRRFAWIRWILLPEVRGDPLSRGYFSCPLDLYPYPRLTQESLDPFLLIMSLIRKVSGSWTRRRG